MSDNFKCLVGPFCRKTEGGKTEKNWGKIRVMVEETKQREKIRLEKLKDLFFLLYVNRKKERQL
jgi:hypothetical protein